MCSEPRKLDRFWLEFSALIPWLGGAESDEGIEVFGRPEGVHSEAGRRRHAGCGYLPQGRDQPGDVLQLEEEVRWAAADRDAAAEAARGRERQAAEGRCGSEPRQGDASGRPPPKTLKPVRKRKLVDEMRGDWDVSIRRACRVFLVDTSTYHYKSRRPGQAALEQRIRGDLPDACALRLSARPCAAAP